MAVAWPLGPRSSARRAVGGGAAIRLAAPRRRRGRRRRRRRRRQPPAPTRRGCPPLPTRPSRLRLRRPRHERPLASKRGRGRPGPRRRSASPAAREALVGGPVLSGGTASTPCVGAGAGLTAAPAALRRVASNCLSIDIAAWLLGVGRRGGPVPTSNVAAGLF